MVCLYCKHKTQVTNSRSSSKTHTTWRRRSCDDCGALFTTRETVELDSSLRIKNSSGVLSPFVRDILFLSIHGSVSHRDTATLDAGALTDTVTTKLLYSAQRGVIETSSIVNTVMQVLTRFDPAASAYYNARH